MRVSSRCVAVLLRRFLRLPAVERWLLLKAALLLGLLRLGLWLLPFPTLRRLVGAFTARFRRVRDAEPISKAKAVWAVETAARYGFPSATCLTQALAVQVLLARRGYPALLHIGVARGEKELKAHAWVESEGEVVIGGFELERYTPLTTLR
jgi:hypothetical protein